MSSTVTEVLRWPSTLAEWQGFLSRWGLTPQTAALALALGHYAAQLGLQLRITSGKRTQAEQDALTAAYKKGTAGIFKPAAKSKHLTGQAFDVVLVSGGQPNELLGRLGKLLGLRWGGSFVDPDPVHFDVLS